MDYKETTVSGTQWQRCNAVSIINTYGETPTIHLREEVITQVGDQQFKEAVGGLFIKFDPAAVIPLLDPTTGASLGASMTQGQIHVALWSLYMQSAQARDGS